MFIHIFSVLLKFGVHPRNGQRNGQGLTALQQAVFDGNARLAVKLLEVNAIWYHKEKDQILKSNQNGITKGQKI